MSATSKRSRRRAPLWRGWVPARALYFPAGLPDLGPRVIAAWCAGARLYGLGRGVLLALPNDLRIDARTAPGEVFVDVDGVLSSAPLAPAERQDLPIGALVRMRAGVRTTLLIRDLPELEVGALVDVSGLTVAATAPLALPAPPVPVVVAPKVDARAKLLGDSKPDPERERVARALATETGRPPLDDSATPLQRAQARADGGLPAQGLGESMLRAVVRALESTGLMEKLRSMQQKYLEETLELLKSGNIDDALKRAVPLAQPRPGVRPEAPPSLGVPRPRDTLKINPRPGTGGTSPITVDDDLYTRVRQSYRAVAKKLEQEKRWKEAAFVYVELLGEVREALSVLEKSKDPELLRTAAELAESFELSAGLIVRQWWIAGDRARAIETARRRRAFQEAVTLLDASSDIESARSLRLHWAEHLGKTGDHGRAVDVLLAAVPRAHPAVRAAIDGGITAGGSDVPRLLVMRATDDVHASPEAAPRDHGRLEEIIAAQTPDAFHDREQMAVAFGPSPAESLRPLTAALARVLIADAAGTARDVRRLVENLADPGLRADLPPTPPPTTRHPAQSLVLDGPPGRSVATAIAAVPGGRLLCGLGEAGAMMVTWRGGIASRTTEPCDTIVMHDRGESAVLVAQRGMAMRMARFNVATGRARPWIDVRAHRVAPTTDGDLLFIGRNDQLVGLDLLADTARVLFESTIGSPPLTIGRDESHVAVVYRPDDDDRPVLLVRIFDARTLVAGPPRELLLPLPPNLQIEVNPIGTAIGVTVGMAQPIVVPVGTFHLQLPAGAVTQREVVVSRRTAAVAWEGATGAGVVAHATPGHRLVIELRGARTTALHVAGTTLVIADDRGRAFVVDALSGALLQRVALP